MHTYNITADEFLDPYVKLMVFYSNENAALERRYIFFPNVGASLTFYFDTEFYATSSHQFISKEKKGCSGIVLQINRTAPVEIIDIGRQNRVTVVFKPLGVNHFISTSLNELRKEQNPSAIQFKFSQSTEKLCEYLQMRHIDEKKCTILKSYLQELYRGFDNIVLKEIVQLLVNGEKNEKLSTISRRVGASTRTINRLFNEHICISPVEFRKIVQFRNSVAIMLGNNANSLYELALKSDYYDLPYMMKAYQKLTGQSAKKFFETSQVLAKGLYLFQGGKL